jgi:F-type H+-transporting ATPase subunit delta
LKNLAIAKRYAQALYLEAKAENKLKEISKDFETLSEIILNKEFAALMNNATLTGEDARGVLGALYKKNIVSKLTYAFLTVLSGKRRLSILPEAISAFAAFVREENNEVLAEVVYAAEVGEPVRGKLVSRLKTITGKNIILKEAVDPALLGGLKVVIGSTLYDASIRGGISAMKALLR